MLLHGVAGQATEWNDTARWLSKHNRVVALDQRGHGHSQEGLRDLSRDAYVRDAAAAITTLHLPPVVVVGQSMGGVVAFLLTARRPELVKALVAVEADPTASARTARDVEKWLNSWPAPFKNRLAAVAFFGGNNLKGRTWAAMLERRRSGYWPVFEREDVLAAAADSTDHWAEWQNISRPTLVVGAGRGLARRTDMRRMVGRLKQARYVELPDAGHDLHLEQPEAWRKLLLEFLATV
jgi:pimeloyl-ACP methyl ester carboxylesterase